MEPSDADGRILRQLAARVAEIAADPIQQQRARLWKDHNELRPTRALVLASPEGGWRDLLKPEDCLCQDKLLRQWEWALRSRIFRHEHIGDDMPITDTFRVGWVLHLGNWGVEVPHVRTEQLGSYRWAPPIKHPRDVDKLRFRTVTVDRDESRRRLELARDVLGDCLRVRPHATPPWSMGLTWDLILLRGLDQMMFDLFDNPGLLHDLMAFLRDDRLGHLEALQAEGILSLNNGPDDMVGSGGLGHTGELPAPGFDGTVRLGDLWGLAESQEFVGVGPRQFNEFALQYQLPLINRFGLACYGCCEPLDAKFDLILDNIPRLRRVSVSPWCDRELAAAKLSDRYVYSWKPNPALICAPTVNWDEVEAVTRRTLAIARSCRLEMVMKDTHTFQGDATRPGRWARLCLRLAEQAA